MKLKFHTIFLICLQNIANLLNVSHGSANNTEANFKISLFWIFFSSVISFIIPNFSSTHPSLKDSWIRLMNYKPIWFVNCSTPVGLQQILQLKKTRPLTDWMMVVAIRVFESFTFLWNNANFSTILCNFKNCKTIKILYFRKTVYSC